MINRNMQAETKKGKHAASLFDQLAIRWLLTGGVDLDQRLVQLRRQRLAFARYPYRRRLPGSLFLRCTQLLGISGSQRQTG